MYLVVGLGNPDKKYEETRHNIGFKAIDFLAEKLAFEQLKNQNQLKCLLGLGEINERRVILAKPMTYMNASGEALQLIKNYYKIQNENIIVIYDELDLPFEEIRVRDSGSSAGHRGVKSIIEYLASEEFKRIRVGIRNKEAEKIPADRFVLARFSFWEKRKLKKNILPQIAEQIIKLVQE